MDGVPSQRETKKNKNKNGHAANASTGENVDEKLQLVAEATGAEVTVALYLLAEAQGDTQLAINNYLDLQAASLREQAVSASRISEKTLFHSPPPPSYESHKNNVEIDVDDCNIRDYGSADSFDNLEFHGEPNVYMCRLSVVSVAPQVASSFLSLSLSLSIPHHSLIPFLWRRRNTNVPFRLTVAQTPKFGRQEAHEGGKGET
jgi:hypothetical protein